MPGDHSAARPQGLWPTALALPQLPHLRSHVPMVSAPDIHNLIDIHYTAAQRQGSRGESLLGAASHRPIIQYVAAPPHSGTEHVFLVSLVLEFLGLFYTPNIYEP
jgi:hypothetical protein